MRNDRRTRNKEAVSHERTHTEHTRTHPWHERTAVGRAEPAVWQSMNACTLAVNTCLHAQADPLRNNVVYMRKRDTHPVPSRPYLTRPRMYTEDALRTPQLLANTCASAMHGVSVLPAVEIQGEHKQGARPGQRRERCSAKSCAICTASFYVALSVDAADEQT